MLSVIRIVGVSFVMLSGAVSGQSWPTKPVRIIISNGPGSSPDIVARMMTDRLARTFKQQFLVENRVGGEGVIGAEAAAKSPADGYSYYFGTNVALATAPYLFKSLPYDPAKDFTPVAMLVDSAPFIIAVHPDVPAKNIADLVALAKAQPEKLSYATSTSLANTTGEWLSRAAGIRMQQVWYKVVPQAVSDTVARRTDAVIIALPNVEAFVKAGKLRLVAVTSTKRFPTIPDVPTVTEHVPGVVVEGWFALMAPSGSPADPIQRINREIEQFLKEPDVVQRLHSFGFATSGASTPQAMGEFIRGERERWGRVFREVGFKPQ
jgi:tripartite-type tricarboxylate transporter receptor subunit TctC